MEVFSTCSTQNVEGNGTMVVSIVISEVLKVAEAVVEKPSLRSSRKKSITDSAVLRPNSAMEASPTPANTPTACDRMEPRSDLKGKIMLVRDGVRHCPQALQAQRARALLEQALESRMQR